MCQTLLHGNTHALASRHSDRPLYFGRTTSVVTDPKDYEATDAEVKELIKQVQKDEDERAKRGTGEESVE